MEEAIAAWDNDLDNDQKLYRLAARPSFDPIEIKDKR
jgi:hypothetical protein